MFKIVVINDCRDDNARLRQEVRYGAYFAGSSVVFAGAANDVEAAFLVADALDALDGSPGVIAANVAPRNGAAKKHANGTPFGVVKVGETFVFASIDGATLRVLNKLLPGLSLQVYNLPDVVQHLTQDEVLQQHIVQTQFRSFEFLPRVAKVVALDGKSLPGDIISLADHCGEDNICVVALVDCFGNLKTTLLPEDVGFEPGRVVELKVGGSTHHIACFARLKDIPDGQIGLTIGSSGYGRHRFLEIMCQGGSASQQLNAKVGTPVHLVK